MPAAKTSGASAKSKAPEYEDETMYEVTLTRIVDQPGDPSTKLSPGHTNMMSGKLLSQIDPGAVADAKPVQ